MKWNRAHDLAGIFHQKVCIIKAHTSDKELERADEDGSSGDGGND